MLQQSGLSRLARSWMFPLQSVAAFAHRTLAATASQNARCDSALSCKPGTRDLFANRRTPEQQMQQV